MGVREELPCLPSNKEPLLLSLTFERTSLHSVHPALTTLQLPQSCFSSPFYISSSPSAPTAPNHQTATIPILP